MIAKAAAGGSSLGEGELEKKMQEMMEAKMEAMVQERLDKMLKEKMREAGLSVNFDQSKGESSFEKSFGEGGSADLSGLSIGGNGKRKRSGEDMEILERLKKVEAQVSVSSVHIYLAFC